MNVKSLLSLALLFFTTFSVNAAKFRIANGDVAALEAAAIAVGSNNQADTIYLAYKGVYTISTAKQPVTPFTAGLVFFDDNLNSANKVVIYGNGSVLERDQNAAMFRLITVIGYVELNDLHFRNGLVDIYSDGAGIYNVGTMWVNRCTFTNNKGAFRGGAVCGALGGYIRMVNCTVTGNSAAFASALFFPFADADVINCTITKNTCAGLNGKVAVATGTTSLDPNSHVNITNCIIADNTDSDGTYSDVGGGLRSGSGNLIGSVNDPHATNFIFSDQTGTPALPIAPLLGPLTDNGGLVPTMAIASDASPAYQKATNQFAPKLDQVGKNRVGNASRGSMERTPANLAFLKPQMRLAQGTDPLADHTGTYNFQPALVNQQGNAVSFTIINNFNSTYILKFTTDPRVFITGTNAEDFTLSADAVLDELAPLDGTPNTTFEILFTPKSLGAKTATVQIPSNDSDHPLFEFIITGTAVNIMPIQLLSFTAQSQPNGVVIKWKTVAEKNNNRFEIWRRGDDSARRLIGSVKASGNSSGQGNYQFLDGNPLMGNNYYELKQIDKDEKSATFEPLLVNYGLLQNKMSVYPDGSKLMLSVYSTAMENASIQIYDLGGKLRYQQLVTLQLGNNRTTLNPTLEKGVYVIQLKGKKLMLTQKIISSN